MTARVVAVEDDPEVRTLLRALLGRADGFDLVGETADGAQAVDLVLEVQPDIVLLDLMMPGLDGRELLPMLVEKAPQTMVAVLSSLRASDEAAGTFASGAFAYLEKSLLGPRLVDELAEVYSRFQRALAGETVWAPEIRGLTEGQPG